MSAIDKILNKFNKAKNAINSLKGIQSKIKSINYTSALDKLEEQSTLAKDLLEQRGLRLQESLTNVTDQSFSYASKIPATKEQQMVYPYHDKLANYIVFNIRPRNNTALGGQGKKRGDTGLEDHPVFKERSIALYIPDTLISQANVQYRQEGMNSIAGMVASLIEKGGENFGQNATAVITEQALKMANGMSGGLAGLKAGVAINPKNEQLLDGIPFRSWDFTFDFYPKSQTEATMIRRIIYAFRSSMLPDTASASFNRNVSVQNNASSEVVKDENGNDLDPGLNLFFTNKDGTRITDDNKADNPIFDFTQAEDIQNVFLYPNIFDIQFIGPLAGNIDGFLPAVCTNAQVDYSGGQKFSTHSDGMPTKIQLTLNFLEIQIMSLNNYDSIRAGKLSETEKDLPAMVLTPSKLNDTHTNNSPLRRAYYGMTQSDINAAEAKRKEEENSS